jgi:predicted MFS family arabinose efflux permease
MGLVSHFASETGFNTLSRSSRDVKLMCLQRFVRLFAYGSCFIILVQFFSSLGISDDQIGLFMTLTLLGDAVISLVLTLITDQVGRRSVLVLGSASMIFSGFFFVVSSNYWILLIASVFGVISPR